MYEQVAFWGPSSAVQAGHKWLRLHPPRMQVSEPWGLFHMNPSTIPYCLFISNKSVSHNLLYMSVVFLTRLKTSWKPGRQ